MEDTAASLAFTLIASFCAVIIAVGVGSGLWSGARKLYHCLDDWRWNRTVRRLVTDDDTYCAQCVDEIRAWMPKAHIVPLGRPLTCRKHLTAVTAPMRTPVTVPTRPAVAYLPRLAEYHEIAVMPVTLESGGWN